MEREDLPLKYLWVAYFEDGHYIEQPLDDHYSKHDETAIHNPSAFRDIQDYEKVSPVVTFSLYDPKNHNFFRVDLRNGTTEFVRDGVQTVRWSLEKPGEHITNRQLIYYRTRTLDLISGDQSIVSYTMGYKGTDHKGHVVERTITI